MELEGQAPVEGERVDRSTGSTASRVDIVMMLTPDGDRRLELTKFHAPAVISAGPANALANTLGPPSIHVRRRQPRLHGREPRGPRRVREKHHPVSGAGGRLFAWPSS
jgi:hypothetical protein